MDEALALAERDPELRLWFEEQQRLDHALRRKLRTATPPPDLLADIVVGFPHRATVAQARWLRPLALAAAIAVLMGVGALLWNRTPSPEPRSLAAFQTDMSSFLKTFPRLDLYSEKHSVVREWLATKPRFAAAQLPPTLEKFPAIGCRELDWRGQPAALVCFMVDGEVVHLFLLPKQPWGTAIEGGTPQFGRAGKFSSATWSQGDVTCVAVTRASEGFLKARLVHRTG